MLVINIQRLYEGQEFREEHYNELVRHLAGLIDREQAISEDMVSFKKGDAFENSMISFHRDSEGYIDIVYISIHEKTYRAPFTSKDNGLTFSNKEITNVDPEGDFQVLLPSGEGSQIILPSMYNLSPEGIFTFGQPLGVETIYVTGMTYTSQKIVYVKRNDYHEITGFSMTPNEQEFALTKQLLHPELLANKDIFSLTGSSVTGETSYKIFSMKKEGASFSTNQATLTNRAGDIIFQFNEPLIVTELTFKREKIEGKSMFFSFDLYSSNDGTAWERVARYRNLSESDRQGINDKDDIFKFEIGVPREGRYYKMDILDWGTNSKFVAMSDLKFYGYHPVDRKLYFENIMGRYLANGESFNGDVYITSNYSKFVAAYTHGDYTNPNTVDTGSYVQFEFVEPKTVHSFRINRPDTVYDNFPKEFELWGSLDAKSWTLQGEYTRGEWGKSQTQIFQVQRPRLFKFFKLVLKSANGNYAGTVRFGRISLHGK